MVSHRESSSGTALAGDPGPGRPSPIRKQRALNLIRRWSETTTPEGEIPANRLAQSLHVPEARIVALIEAGEVAGQRRAYLDMQHCLPLQACYRLLQIFWGVDAESLLAELPGTES